MQSIPSSHFLKIHVNMILPSMPSSPHKTVYLPLPSPTRTTYTAYLTLYFTELKFFALHTSFTNVTAGRLSHNMAEGSGFSSHVLWNLSALFQCISVVTAAVFVHFSDGWTVHRALSTMDSRKIKCLQEFTSHVPSDVDRKRALTEDKPPDDIPVLQKIVWRNVIFFIYTHLAALYGFYLMIFKAKGLTVLFGEYLHYTVTIMWTG